ncbi:HAD-IA family hydrolase [uncultured Sphaerochaeta sp.]|uniref:HAD family hydrolase n=1 Tax=uncultured Sphaerochaeta sp. TaxID=886478 RepID=UPI002A0A898D|nr:HAD-IA family hydrolase [uncultured Sphaerochaeta sp.]
MTQNDLPLKGIIFDKDGTLFDYAQVWGEVLVESISEAFITLGKPEKESAKIAMLRMLGIDHEGKVIPKGLVFTHKKVTIILRFILFCLRYRINALKAFKAYQDNVRNSEPLIKEKLNTMDFSIQQELFRLLKQKEYHIGIITSDTTSSTHLFLSMMGLKDQIDFISARDSGYKRKPNADSFQVFCSLFGLDNRQVAVVGDTGTDMKFAKNCKAGYRIALLSGSNNKKLLEKKSDVLYDDISGLLTDKRLFLSV